VLGLFYPRRVILRSHGLRPLKNDIGANHQRRQAKPRADLVRELYEGSPVVLSMVARSYLQSVVDKFVENGVGDELSILIERARVSMVASPS
jgi:hypothetical protein